MSPGRDDNRIVLLVVICVLLSRIPFLFAGFGSEEYAWGLILIARQINLTGIYEVSRLPGHPVQEYMLSLIWDHPSWLLNLMTVLVSSAGIYFFIKALQKLALTAVNPVFAGVALAFTPVYFINSTNIMDYTWALSLVLISFYFLISGQLVGAALFLGIACGFRITAGGMLITFMVWHFMNYRDVKAVVLMGILTVIVALICFIPPLYIYGTGFFTYYEYFPYPPFLKNVYKGTVGAWGVIGFIAVLISIPQIIIKCIKILKAKENIYDGAVANAAKIKYKSLVILCLLCILLYTYSFLKIPQKTAFVLPVVPFFIILCMLSLTKKQFYAFTFAMVVSSFFVGINLDDPIRGSKASPLSVKFIAGSTPVTLDFLSGPVPAEHTKRKLKIAYAQSVISNLENTKQKITVVAGWWQNELKYFSLAKPNNYVSYLYYADRQELRDSITSGNKIYFLPEQDFYNDLRFKDSFTKELAEPFPTVQQ
jgi:hypothetical protein